MVGMYAAYGVMELEQRVKDANDRMDPGCWLNPGWVEKRMESDGFEGIATKSDWPPFGGIKGFKGKGALRRRLRQLEDARSEVHRRMQQLSMATRDMRVRYFAMEMDRNRPDAALMLRWRMTLGNHALWGRDIEPLLHRFPVELQNWYRALNIEAQMLNAEERCLRYTHRTLSRLLDQLEK